jgi:hypothetical protein
LEEERIAILILKWASSNWLWKEAEYPTKATAVQNPPETHKFVLAAICTSWNDGRLQQMRIVGSLFKHYTLFDCKVSIYSDKTQEYSFL